jgi:hypothetical protein
LLNHPPIRFGEWRFGFRYFATSRKRLRVGPPSWRFRPRFLRRDLTARPAFTSFPSSFDYDVTGLRWASNEGTLPALSDWIRDSPQVTTPFLPSGSSGRADQSPRLLGFHRPHGWL